MLNDGRDQVGVADDGADGMHCNKTFVHTLQHFVTGSFICFTGTELIQDMDVGIGMWENAAACTMDQSTEPLLFMALLLFHTELDPCLRNW